MMTKVFFLKTLDGQPFLCRGWASLKCHPRKNRQKVLFCEWNPSSEGVAICVSVKPCYLVEGMRLGKTLRMPRVRALGLGL